MDKQMPQNEGRHREGIGFVVPIDREHSRANYERLQKLEAIKGDFERYAQRLADRELVEALVIDADKLPSVDEQKKAILMFNAVSGEIFARGLKNEAMLTEYLNDKRIINFGRSQTPLKEVVLQILEGMREAASAPAKIDAAIREFTACVPSLTVDELIASFALATFRRSLSKTETDIVLAKNDIIRKEIQRRGKVCIPDLKKHLKDDRHIESFPGGLSISIAGECAELIKKLEQD